MSDEAKTHADEPIATMCVDLEDCVEDPDVKRALRIAAAQIGVHEQTAFRAALGLRTRGDTRARLAVALKALGLDLEPEATRPRDVLVALSSGPSVPLFPGKVR